jgi:hypothetical protein
LFSFSFFFFLSLFLSFSLSLSLLFVASLQRIYFISFSVFKSMIPITQHWVKFSQSLHFFVFEFVLDVPQSQKFVCELVTKSSLRNRWNIANSERFSKTDQCRNLVVSHCEFWNGPTNSNTLSSTWNSFVVSVSCPRTTKTKQSWTNRQSIIQLFHQSRYSILKLSFDLFRVSRETPNGPCLSDFEFELLKIKYPTIQFKIWQHSIYGKRLNSFNIFFSFLSVTTNKIWNSHVSCFVLLLLLFLLFLFLFLFLFLLLLLTCWIVIVDRFFQYSEREVFGQLHNNVDLCRVNTLQLKVDLAVKSLHELREAIDEATHSPLQEVNDDNINDRLLNLITTEVYIDNIPIWSTEQSACMSHLLLTTEVTKFSFVTKHTHLNS